MNLANPKLGRWSFILGIVIAILLGFVSFPYSSVVLVVLGLIVGILNVREAESSNYLIAVIALLVIGFSGLQVFMVLNVGLYQWVQTVLTSFITFVAASGAIVALKAIVRISEE